MGHQILNLENLQEFIAGKLEEEAQMNPQTEHSI